MIDQNKWRFYGRRVGRKLNKSRQEVLDSLLPVLGIPEDQLTSAGDLDPQELFVSPLLSSLRKQGSSELEAPGPGFHRANLQKNQKIVLEIGFGNGERLAEHMLREPDTGFIGAEPFMNGMTAFLRQIKEQNTFKKGAMPASGRALENIRVLMDDALPLVKSLKPHSIDEIYVLNPDPWHKKRHHQRRIINQDNLTEFSRILKPTGKLSMSTDVRDLIEWMVTECSIHPDFDWTAKNADDWRIPPENWIPTRYETKGAKGADKMNYLFFVKNN